MLGAWAFPYDDSPIIMFSRHICIMTLNYNIMFSRHICIMTLNYNIMLGRHFSIMRLNYIYAQQAFFYNET